MKVEPPRPLALLLGWGGARPHQLQRYDELYQARGFEVLSFISDWRSIARPWLGRAATESFADQVSDALGWRGDQQTPRPCVVHALSNNGFIAYGALLDHERCGPALRNSVALHVFDSAPGIPDPLDSCAFGHIFGRGIGTVVAGALHVKAPALRTLIEVALMPVFAAGFVALPWMRRSVAGGRRRFAECAPSAPLLAIYSYADRLVDARIVEDFLRTEAQRAGPVSRLRLSDSAHVAHLKQSQVLYEEALDRALALSFPMLGSSPGT